MANIECDDCGKTFDNEMQLQFHICLDVDPIKEVHLKDPDIILDFSKIDWRHFYKFIVKKA